MLCRICKKIELPEELTNMGDHWIFRTCDECGELLEKMLELERGFDD